MNDSIPDNNIIGNIFLRPEEVMLKTLQSLPENNFSVYSES